MAIRGHKFCGGVPNEYTVFMNVVGLFVVLGMRPYRSYTGAFYSDIANRFSFVNFN